MSLELENETFDKLLPKLLAAGHNGRIAVVHRDQLVGLYDRLSEAMKAGNEAVPADVPFLIREIQLGHQTIHMRPVSPNPPPRGLRLYEIAAELRNLIEQFCDEDGEVMEGQSQLEWAFDELKVAFEKKVEAICAVVREAQLAAEALNKEADRLHYLRFKKLATVSRLKEYLTNCLRMVGTRKANTAWFKVRLVTNPPKVEIDDEAEVPVEFTQSVVTINKKLILEEHKRGGIVPGTRVVQGEHLRIE